MSNVTLMTLKGKSSNTITIADGTSLEGTGIANNQVIQTVIIRSNTKASYASTTSGNGTEVTPLALTITPQYADSLLLMQWNINGEYYWNNLFVVHKNGNLIANTGYEGYNSEAGNQAWSGIANGHYDNSYSSTPENFCIIYAIPADTTEEQTFTPAVRGAAATAFLLNRTQSSTGADSNENTVSSGIIMEIRQL